MTFGNICKCCKNINPNNWTITWSVFIFSPNKLRLVKQVGAMWRPEKQKHHVQLLRFSIFQSLSPRADTSVKCFIYTRAMVKFLWRCDGDNLFLKAMQYRYFLDTFYHCYCCDYSDLTIVDHDMFFSQFLIGFHVCPRYFHGLHAFCLVFMVVQGISMFSFISLSLPSPTTQFLI